MQNILSNPVVIGVAAGILTAISMVPQLAKMIKAKKAEDVSIGMLIVLLCGVAFWVYYGALKKDLPVLITNSFSFLVNTLMMIFSLKYKNKN